MMTHRQAASAGTGRVALARVMDDFGALAADLEQLLKATAGQTGQHLAEVRTRAEASLQTAKACMTGLQDAALAKTVAAGRATDTYVRANPWPFIALGTVAGLVLGLAAARGARADR